VAELDLGASRSDPWLLVYEGFDPAQETYREAGGSRKGESGWAGYGVPTAVNDGSELLIFAVLRRRDRLTSGNR
jgi:hypothetical protein